MARKVYVGANNTARRTKCAYIGVNGVARKVKKVYVGVNGVARLVAEATAYTITFDANGGSGSMSPMYTEKTFTSRKIFTTPSCGFTRSGYVFSGWEYSYNGDTYAVLPDVRDYYAENITMKATWIPTVTIRYTKTADLNWAAATIYPNLTSHTGPVEQNPPYLRCTLTTPWGTSGYPDKLDFNKNFTYEEGRSMQSISIPFIGSAEWQTPGQNVKGYSDTIPLTVPKGTTLTFTLNNSEYHGGSLCAIYKANDTADANRVWGPGQSKSIGTYTYTVNSDINIRANWKTSGEYVPGVTEVLQYVGIGSSTDDRNSWWDVHIY